MLVADSCEDKAQLAKNRRYTRCPMGWYFAFSQLSSNISVLSEKGGNMPMKRIVGWGFVVVLWALVSIPALAADKSDVAARAATWEKEYNAGNLAAVVALYAPDGCRMPPNQEAVHGRDAILAQLKAGKDRGFAQVKIAVTAADSSGDIGYGTGTYVVTGADGSHVDHGKWMLASKKVNGNWVTQCDIFNSDMPMPSGAMK